MRLWSLSPEYLDSKGLVAMWREALLARKVLAGETRGYTHHPQLKRFRATADPMGAISRFLAAICDEAERRGYSFDRSKIPDRNYPSTIPVTKGQVLYELEHLKKKLKERDPSAYELIKNIENPSVHPLFHMVEGDVEPWEIR